MFEFFQSSSIVCWQIQNEIKSKKENILAEHNPIFCSVTSFYTLSVKISDDTKKDIIIYLNSNGKDICQFTSNGLLTAIKSSKQFYITHCLKFEPWMYIKFKRLAFLKCLNIIQNLLIENNKSIAQTFEDVENIIQQYLLLAPYKVTKTFKTFLFYLTDLTLLV